MLHSTTFVVSRALTIFLLSAFVLGAHRNDEQEGNRKDLERCLSASLKALRYYQSNLVALSLDAVLGVRIFQSNLQSVIEREGKASSISRDVLNMMKTIQIEANRTAELGLKLLPETRPAYYRELGPLISPNFWDGQLPVKKLNQDLIWQLKIPRAIKMGVFTETESDVCLAELLGTYSRKSRCFVSSKCWRMMILSDAFLYMATHQVLYILIGIKSNCQHRFDEITSAINNQQSTLSEIMTRKCSIVFHDGLLIEKRNYPKSARDLLMEQIGLCGTLGFLDLAQSQWLPHILKWQRTNGCYGTFPNEDTDRILSKPFMAQFRDMETIVYGEPQLRKDETSSRSKRFESEDVDGCLSHRTSVALTALSVYIRALTEPLPAMI